MPEYRSPMPWYHSEKLDQDLSRKHLLFLRASNKKGVEEGKGVGKGTRTHVQRDANDMFARGTRTKEGIPSEGEIPYRLSKLTYTYQHAMRM